MGHVPREKQCTRFPALHGNSRKVVLGMFIERASRPGLGGHMDTQNSLICMTAKNGCVRA